MYVRTYVVARQVRFGGVTIRQYGHIPQGTLHDQWVLHAT